LPPPQRERPGPRTWSSNTISRSCCAFRARPPRSSSAIRRSPGKTFGITNIIALDADRNVIQDQRVLVKRDESKTVNLQRGTQRQSYNCTPQCNPSITIGDEQKYFDAVTNASQKKITFSTNAADASQPGSN
jgi:hypothetical protein